MPFKSGTQARKPRRTQAQILAERNGLTLGGLPLYPEGSIWREKIGRDQGNGVRAERRTLRVTKVGTHRNSHQPGQADITNVYFSVRGEDGQYGRDGTMMAVTLTERWERMS